MRRYVSSIASLLALAFAMSWTAGCLTERQRALLERRPSNRVSRPEDINLPPGEAYSFMQIDRGGSQDLVSLTLAPGARLEKRYHRDHDLTMFIAAGSAIVMVEETRYFVEAGAAIILPRYTAYAVIPHKAESPVKAVLVFSPPYDPDDVHLTD